MKNSNTSIVLTSSLNNPYLAADGLLDKAKLDKLVAQVNQVISKYSAPLSKAKSAFKVSGIASRNRKQIVDLLIEKGLIEKPRQIAPSMTNKAKNGTFTLTLPRDILFGEFTPESIAELLGQAFPPKAKINFATGKSKYNDYDAKKNKAGDEYTYLTRRCLPVKEVAKVTTKTQVLFLAYGKDVVGEKLFKQTQFAVKALRTHAKALDGIKAKLKDVKAVVAEQRAEDFEAAAEEMKMLLSEALPGSDVEKIAVVSQGVMGKNMQVKLPSGLIVSVSLSKPANFEKAKAGPEEKPAKKAKTSTKKTVKVTGNKERRNQKTAVKKKAVVAKKKAVVAKKKAK